MTDDIDSKPIKEKNVQNKIKINPKLGEAVEEIGGKILEMAEVKEGDGDPCWDSHKQVGMKKKGGKMVPNCVPKNEEVEVEGYEPMTPARKERVSRQSDKSYAKEVVAAYHGKSKEANKQMQRRIAMKDPAGRKAALKKEEYIDEAIPAQAIEEATKNRTSREVLANLRKVLAVDSSLMSESVKEAVVDGKSQIDQLAHKVAKLEKENGLLREAYTKTKADLLLESKTSHLTGKKKEYMLRILSDKSPKFIEENFEYTERLFDKKEKERLSVIKEEAFVQRKVKADAPQPKLSEKKREPANPYLQELKRSHK